MLFAQAFALALIAVARAQNYDDYSAEEEAEDHSGIEAEVAGRQVDYSKYYNPQSGQISRADNGFVEPIEFSSFFATPDFGPSDKQKIQVPVPAELNKEAAGGFGESSGGFSEYNANNFGAQDFFDQAQNQQVEAEVEPVPKPGPHYISHTVRNPKAQQQRQRRPQYEEEAQRAKTTPFNPAYHKQYSDVAQQVSPYQKYSFQPAASTYGLKAPASTAVPYNPTYGRVASTPATQYEIEASEIISQALKGRECVRVNKQVTDTSAKFSKQPMDCYVCKDPKTGAKYEQCSYSNQPNPKGHYTSHVYSSPETPRNKRDEKDSYVDPYEEIKAKSHTYFSKPEEFENDYYKPPDFSKIHQEYKFPEIKIDTEQEKSFSEQESEKLVKKGDNCQKSTKNGVTCTVCQDAKTGANYEQCSYQTEPNEKKYAYVKETKYDGDGNPVDEKVSGDYPQETKQEEEQEEEEEEEDDKAEPESSKVSEDFVQSALTEKSSGPLLLDAEIFPTNKKATKNAEETGPQKFTSLDDYHRKFFPELSKEETRNEETRAEADASYYDELAGKKDVAKVLEEFAKKDRSNCKQINKKGMTCYLCVDKKGIQQEECMFVSESQPKSSKIAYHEMQKISVPQNDSAAPEGAESKRKRVFKKVESEKTRTKRQADQDGITHDNERTDDKEKLNDANDPKPQFNVNDEGGLYSAETEPVFSEVLGLTLPRYMLEKTPFERDFDKSNGRH